MNRSLKLEEKIGIRKCSTSIGGMRVSVLDNGQLQATNLKEEEEEEEVV